MAVPFHATQTSELDHPYDHVELHQAIQLVSLACCKAFHENDDELAQVVAVALAAARLPGRWECKDIRCTLAICFMNLSNQLSRTTGSETEIVLFSRGVHLGDPPKQHAIVKTPADYHPEPHLQPDAKTGCRVRGTLALDASLYPAIRVADFQHHESAPALPESVHQLRPAAGSLLALQDRSWAYADEDGGFFTVWAKNDYCNGTWIPLGFWTAFRRDGVGDGADANGRADFGWQIVRASRAARATGAGSASSSSAAATSS